MKNNESNTPTLTIDDFAAPAPTAAPPGPPRLASSLLDALRIDQNFDELAEVEELVTTVPLGKPNRQWFVRTHPTWSYRTFLFKDKEDRDRNYFVMPEVAPLIRSDLAIYMLLLGVTTTGIYFFWPLKLPDATGKLDTWSKSAHAAAGAAKDNWVRMYSDPTQPGSYRVSRAGGDKGEPKWPADDGAISELLLKAAAGNIIDTPEHPIVLTLLGK